ncbi:MAG: phage major capsid protein [Clostridium sp.]|nr:phage major capsid protein [Clostridium sp.]
MTLFEMKEKLNTLKSAILADANWLAEKAADPSTKMEEIKEKQAHRDELQARYDTLKAEHDRMEAEQRAELAVQDGVGAGMTAEKALITAKAAFYRAALTGGDTKKAYEGLGGIPTSTADLGYGENLLPKNVSSELLTEPVEENSLREVEPVSNISGLEEPKLMFSIEDADLADVTDQETAKEIEMEGDTVSYGRFKTKIVATVKDTVLHGTDTDLVGAIEAALRSGLAIKEKMRAFAPATGSGAYDAAHKHMSFYQADDGVTAIKTVTGTDLIAAIINAWADLPEAFAANARCVMRKQDYYAAIRTLANQNSTLWGKKPEDVIGIPVTFNDRAAIPVIGDFRYSKQNYDIGTIYETDKDAKKGEYYFVLTTWGDHQIRLKSAFRLAAVNP